MAAKQRQTTSNGVRYDIHFQVIRGRRVPFVYFESIYGYNLEFFSIEEAEKRYRIDSEHKYWSYEN